MDKTTAVTALQNAVAYLKGQQKIKKEIEISLLTRYAKGSISAYLTGASDADIMSITGHKDFAAYAKYLRDIGIDADFAKLNKLGRRL